MSTGSGRPRGTINPHHQPAIRHLVESALQKVVESRSDRQPKAREEWIETFCDALVSASETSHHRVMASMVASGIPMDEVFDDIVPDASRRLGERWVRDSASFVDVTVGASRLQQLLRSRNDLLAATRDRLIPLGQSILMVIPPFEDHSLGAFLAADQFRRYGLWTHMAIGMEVDEICAQIHARRFGMIGVSVGSSKVVDNLGHFIDYLRTKVDSVPPIVLGGRGIHLTNGIEKRTGADFAIESAREAIERCGLASTVKPLTAGQGL